MKWETVIGLEVHARMTAKQKLFSNSKSIGYFPNQQVSGFDAAIPGTLPRLNQHCVELAVKTALALNATVASVTQFDRKHYFFPDLPNGYQITQQFRPIAKDGYLKFDLHNSDKETRVGIQQIQIEQDSAKTLQGLGNGTLIDLNRAGVGILEIVTNPDLRNSRDTISFLKRMQQLLWHIGVSSPDMDDV
jgi:aspartyl-tRNA(Asn)/glutamyl-tRNA(Gln) amidotransferase subunit B